jgi:long-chain acyl-CoA synthetase
MLSDANLDAAARQTQVQGPVLSGERLLSVVSFSHGLGLAVSVHTVVISGGESIVLPHYTTRHIVKTFRRKRPDYLTGVPHFYAELLSDRKFHRTRLSCLMAAFCGGDRLPAHVRDSFEITVRRQGGAVPIREGYGLTETVTACATAPDGAIRAGSVGVPYPDMDIMIAAPGHRADLSSVPAGTVGEICVNGPTVMMGYWGGGGDECLVRDSEGLTWLRTGDLGRMDEDGYLYFVERTGRSAKLNGNPVYPGTVEDALHAHPEVRRACVAVQHRPGGDRLVASIVPIDSDLDPQWLETTLRTWCSQELGPAQHPTDYMFVQSLPHTRLGIVDYRRVEADVQAAGI